MDGSFLPNIMRVLCVMYDVICVMDHPPQAGVLWL